jgi:hypothetical protein
MHRKDRAQVKKVIAGFEEEYTAMITGQELEEDPIVRAAFYSACLKVVRDGRPFKNPLVRQELIQHYTEALRLEQHRILAFVKATTQP